VEVLARATREHREFAHVIEELLDEAIAQMRRGLLPAGRKRRQKSLEALAALGSAGWRWVNNPEAFRSPDITAAHFLAGVSTRRHE
jgi:hypothetical protein